MTLDATIAGATANSYLTVAAADSYAGDDLGPEAAAWLAAVTADKEKALKRATREIDGYLRSGWVRYSAAQALLFPRAIDYSGTPAAAYLPSNVKLACYEQATYVLRNAKVLDNARTRRARDVQSASEPNISFAERASTTRSGAASPDVDAAMLSDAALGYIEGFRRAGGSRGLTSVRMTSGWL
jgi:phage gp36-like protein